MSRYAFSESSHGFRSTPPGSSDHLLDGGLFFALTSNLDRLGFRGEAWDRRAPRRGPERFHAIGAGDISSAAAAPSATGGIPVGNRRQPCSLISASYHKPRCGSPDGAAAVPASKPTDQGPVHAGPRAWARLAEAGTREMIGPRTCRRTPKLLEGKRGRHPSRGLMAQRNGRSASRTGRW